MPCPREDNPLRIVVQTCGRALRAVLATVSMTILLSSVAISVPWMPRAAGAQGAHDDEPAADLSEIEAAFQREAVQLGLVPAGTAAVASDGNGMLTLVLGATAPLGRGHTPAFFMKRTATAAVDADGRLDVLATSDIVVQYAAGHVTLDLVDRFSSRFAAAPGRAGNLAGMEIRRTAEVDIPDLERLAYAGGSAAGQGQLTQRLLRGELEYDNYTERATVTAADGSTQTYAAGEIDLRETLGDGSAAGAVDCIRQCFSDAGGDIGLLTVVCIVSGATVCAVGCAVTVGVACIPCVLTVGGVCGVAIPTGGAAVCTAQCLFPNASLPTPTRPRTSTPTRTRTATRTATSTPRPPGCVGDCDKSGEVTVDEVLNAIRVALGSESIGRCTAVDTDGNGRVTVDEILTAMGYALNGCVF